MGLAPTDSRYATLLKLASGGMATVWIGTVRGGMGFRQLVAIKKPHPHLLEQPEVRAELLAEAALASSIRHVNVVDVRDVEVRDGEISLIMDYIEGGSVSELLTSSLNGGPRVTPALAVRIMLDALAGLHAAHELVDERGRFVGLVHRDISPQNILVGLDGVARVVDFGVAKFDKKGDMTRDGQLKGKLPYMAPEYLRNEPFDRRADLFALGVVLWETLVAQRLFRGSHDADTLQKVLSTAPPAVSRMIPEAAALDPILARALAKDPAQRYPTAAAMALDLETTAIAAGLVATPRELSEFVRASVGEALEERRARLREKTADAPSVASLFEGVRAVELGVPPTQMAPAPSTQPIDMQTMPLASPLAPRTLPLGPNTFGPRVANPPQVASAPAHIPTLASQAPPPQPTLLSQAQAPQPVAVSLPTLLSQAPQAPQPAAVSQPQPAAVSQPSSTSEVSGMPRSWRRGGAIAGGLLAFAALAAVGLGVALREPVVAESPLSAPSSSTPSPAALSALPALPAAVAPPPTPLASVAAPKERKASAGSAGSAARGARLPTAIPVAPPAPTPPRAATAPASAKPPGAPPPNPYGP